MIELNTALRVMSWTLICIGMVVAIGEIFHLSNETFSLVTMRLCAMLGMGMAMTVVRWLR